MMDQQEQQYQEQMKYLLSVHPNKRLNIEGYGLTNYDAVATHKDIRSIITNFDILCHVCKQRITLDKFWLPMFHNPVFEDDTIPINLIFFDSRECLKQFARSRMKK